MRQLLLISSLIIFLASCEKELDFRYHDVESQLVIEGNVSQDGTTVTLTYTTPMGEPMNLSHLTDADVTLADLTADKTFTLSPDDKGIYTDPTPGITGHEYRVDIRREGKSYTATDLMRPPTRIVSLEFQWIKMPYDHVATLRVMFTDNPGDNDCYWIRIYRNGEPYMWLQSDDRQAVNGIISEVAMTSRKDISEEDDDTVLVEGDVVTATVTPVSRAMYDYLTALQADSNGPQMFAGDFCLGYFLASPVAST
ncbi:MAG: DUF4249 domain-containing protein, partial [Muribaculaceae bacterium]|nr:DUF4249 domain-containing protein [Muribaculaceae bacterium]